MDPIFTGKVLPGGLLVMDRPKDYGRHLRSLAGRPIEVTVRRRKQQRTPQANRFYWGPVLTAIAEATGYTKDEAHDALKYQFLRVQGDGPLVKVRSTASLSVEEFSEYLDRVLAFGATTFGIEWGDRSTWEAA